MTVPEQPSDPAVPVPPTPEPTPEEAAAQQAAAEKAAAEAALNEQIRALAAKIAEQAILAYDPVTRRKGTVASLQTATAPPTITVTISGETTVEIPGVRYYEHYQPQVGDVVHIDKQGTDIVAIGKIAEQVSETAFTDVSLAAGFSHNGNSNGNLKIRRIWDNGQWKVEMQGGVSRTSGTTVATLDSKYRPVNAPRRTVLAARDANGSNVVKIDIESSGVMSLVGMTTAGSAATPAESAHTHGNHEHVIPNNDHEHTGTTSMASPGDSTHAHASHEHVIPASNAGASEHNHAGAVSTVSHSHPTHNHSGTTAFTSLSDSTHNHGNHEHGISVTSHSHGGTTNVTTPNESSHTHGAHSHTADEPTWISFNQVEYYL